MSDLKIKRSEVVDHGKHRAYAVMVVQSMSDPRKEYRVDVTNQRCSCAAWKFQSGPRKPCKHLRALGFGTMEPRPVKSKASSPKKVELVLSAKPKKPVPVQLDLAFA